MPLSPTRRFVLAGLSALPVLSAPRLARAATERPFNLRIVMSGHSLTDPIPNPLGIMVQAAGGAASRGMVIDNSSIPGSTAKLRWFPEMPMEIDAKRDMANYDLLVLTERIPVRSSAAWEDSREIALNWFNRAWTAGNDGKGAETVFYASWIGIGSGPGNTDKYDMQDEGQIPFRERLDLEMGTWQEIADYVNQKRVSGSPPMRVIPGPKIIAAVYDAIQAGTAPGISEMQDLFEDNIHVNAKGAFLIAAAHFAVIYGRDPRDIPKLRGQAGWPSAEQQVWMKSLVREVLAAYPDSGFA